MTTIVMERIKVKGNDKIECNIDSPITLCAWDFRRAYFGLGVRLGYIFNVLVSG